MQDKIVVYSAKLCGDCQELKSFLEKNGIQYENRDIHEDPEHKEILHQKTGKLGVPYLVIGDEWKRGYDPGKPFSDDFAASLIGLGI